MSYEIRRLIKSKSREGDEELFIHLAISDELGIYEYGEWLPMPAIKAMRKEYGKNYDKCNSLHEFKNMKDSKILKSIADDCIPKARANRIQSLEEEKDLKIIKSV